VKNLSMPPLAELRKRRSAPAIAQLQRRAVRVGSLITALGVVHVASTPVFFPESVRSIVDGRILGTLTAEPSAMPVRKAGFWYAMAGVAIAVFGWMTGHVERNGGTLPAALPTVLAGVGATGVALDPQSGFWLFFPLAWIARRRTRRRPSSPRRSTQCSSRSNT
jgi:hypothetical protein